MVSDIKKRLEENYLPGFIKYGEAYNLYLMPLAYWILNYAKYDPSFDPKEDGSGFRNGILNVPDGNIPSFIESINGDLINVDDLIRESADYPDSTNIHLFIDFDAKLFINGMFDNVEPEEYLPDDRWQGKLGYPLDYLPYDLKQKFQK